MRIVLCLCAVLAADGALAQVDLVDPDAPAVKKTPKKRPKAPAPDENDDPEPNTNDGVDAVDPGRKPLKHVDDGQDTTEASDDLEQRLLHRKLTKDAGVKAAASEKDKDKESKDKDSKQPKDKEKDKPADAQKEPAKDKDREKKPPPTLAITHLTDKDLAEAYQQWKSADGRNDVKTEQAARARLLELAKEVAAADSELWAMAMLRAAAAHEARGDSGAAVEIATSASELAPGVPTAWTGLARAYFASDPASPGRFFTALGKAVLTLGADPRYLRPALGDLGAIALLALIGVAMAVVAVLFARRAAYFLYDFHFFFPRVAARWQTGALALVGLSLPIVFRMGIAPVLLVLFAAVSLYLTAKERVVALVLVGALGAVPTLAGLLVQETAFAGTPAEDVYALEKGGAGAEAAEARVVKLVQENKAVFAHFFALGHFQLRRGRADEAERSLKRALELRPDDPLANVNLGVAMVLAGDLENSRRAFEDALKARPELAVAHFNLGRLLQRRVAVYGDTSAGEVDRASSELSEARLKDPSFNFAVSEVEKDRYGGNELLRSVDLPASEVVTLAASKDAADRVRSQLSAIVLGEVPEAVAPFYPLALALGLLGVGLLAKPLGAAKPCVKCGEAVSRRGDPDVSAGSTMCTACVNVFAKKNVVVPALKVRKQLEVARYEARQGRISYVLGLLFAGMGHVFSGLPVRGAVYGFIFLTALSGLLLRAGVVRPPFEPLPVYLRLAPLVLLFVLAYALSLRGLLKRQG